MKRLMLTQYRLFSTTPIARSIHSYIEKHDTVLQLRSKIENQLNDKDHWWHKPSTKADETTQALVLYFETFLNNIQSNFAEDSYAFQQITSTTSANKHLQEILHAILQYDRSMKNWQQALGA